MSTYAISKGIECSESTCTHFVQKVKLCPSCPVNYRLMTQLGPVTNLVNGLDNVILQVLRYSVA